MKLNGSIHYTVVDDSAGGKFANEQYSKVELPYAKISSTVKIGDYVDYKPTISTFDWTETEKDIAYNTYSGGTNAVNLTTEEGVTWRVLDLSVDKVVLIGDSTTATVSLGGYNGYNNAVYLLDNICNRLYSNSKYGTARSIKIEDIETKLSESYVKSGNIGDTITFTSNTYYPNIFIQEPGLEQSKQTNLVDGSNSSDSLTITVTNWTGTIESSSFRDYNEEEGTSIYYELLMNDTQNKFYIASRNIWRKRRSRIFSI